MSERMQLQKRERIEKALEALLKKIENPESTTCLGIKHAGIRNG